MMTENVATTTEEQEQMLARWPMRKIRKAAALAHEVNREYCRGIGDSSQQAWDKAPQWQKDSAMKGVEAIALDPNTTPEQSHESWSKLKIDEGWKFGPKKDADKKEHPCLVPYAELDAAQRAKDAIFGAVVRGVLGI